MSTKIYNGWRWTPESGHPDVFELAGLLRATVTPHVNAARTACLVGLAVDIYDRVARLDDDDSGKSGRSPLLAAERYLSTAATRVRESGRRDPLYDFSCDISLLGDNSNHLYLLTHSEVSLTAALLTVPGMSEYAYWNNCDRPDNIDDGEWAERAEVWDRVLGWDTPANRGVHWSIEDLTFSWAAGRPKDAMPAIDAHIPSRHERAKRIAVTTALDALTVTPDSPTHAIVRRVQETRAEVEADTATIDAIAATLTDINYTHLNTEPVWAP